MRPVLRVRVGLTRSPRRFLGEVREQVKTTVHVVRLLVEARLILASAEFAALRAAACRRVFAEVSVGRRRIVFEPAFPPNRYGMTLSAERGFLLGPRAFVSREDLVRTLLQELYRLDHGDAGGEVDAPRASHRTRRAQRFTERAYALGRTLFLF